MGALHVGGTGPFESLLEAVAPSPLKRLGHKLSTMTEVRDSQAPPAPTLTPGETKAESSQV